MKEIILTRGYKAIVDDEDYDFLNQWNWHISKNHNNAYYAVRWVKSGQKQYKIRMHNEIVINKMNLEIPPKHIVDHIDRKGLHNWHDNLRVVTRSIQNLNKNIRKDNISGVRGVSIDNRCGKYTAYFSINNEQELKYFNTEKEAIIWRQKMEIKYYGKIIP